VPRLLAKRLSTREIAHELVLSYNTIHTHTRSIYTRLDATSRSEAVARARALDLL
jgi:LuxR family maltose regulon positive regulatory protein